MCWQNEGDIMWVYDRKPDGYRARMLWGVPSERRFGQCDNTLGSGTWASCNKDFPELETINFKAGSYDGDTDSYGDWSGWRYMST